MNTLALFIGVAFLAVGLYAYFAGFPISSVLAFVVGAGFTGYALIIPSERQISQKIRRGMVTGLLELGEKKIKNGTFRVDFETFKDAVEKLSPMMADLSSMPEIGFDGIYIRFQTEYEADQAMEKIRKMPLNASVVQNKSEWAVKIDLT